MVKNVISIVIAVILGLSIISCSPSALDQKLTKDDTFWGGTYYRNPEIDQQTCDRAVNSKIDSLLSDDGKTQIYACNPEDTILNRPPELIKGYPPEFPEEAIEKGMGGSFEVLAYIDSEGRVVVCKVEGRPKDMGFEEAIAEAFVKWEWKPAVVCDKPGAVWIKYLIQFENPRPGSEPDNPFWELP